MLLGSVDEEAREEHHECHLPDDADGFAAIALHLADLHPEAPRAVDREDCRANEGDGRRVDAEVLELKKGHVFLPVTDRS